MQRPQRAGLRSVKQPKYARRCIAQPLPGVVVCEANFGEGSMKPVEPTCGKCGRNFASEADLKEHIKTCKGGHEPPAKDSSRT